MQGESLIWWSRTVGQLVEQLSMNCKVSGLTPWFLPSFDSSCHMSNRHWTRHCMLNAWSLKCSDLSTKIFPWGLIIYILKKNFKKSICWKYFVCVCQKQLFSNSKFQTLQLELPPDLICINSIWMKVATYFNPTYKDLPCVMCPKSVCIKVRSKVELLWNYTALQYDFWCLECFPSGKQMLNHCTVDTMHSPKLQETKNKNTSNILLFT